MTRSDFAERDGITSVHVVRHILLKSYGMVPNATGASRRIRAPRVLHAFSGIGPFPNTLAVAIVDIVRSACGGKVVFGVISVRVRSVTWARI
jgi:hypothetical protein